MDIHRLLEPKSVVVVGAGNNPASMGARQLKMLADYGFAGDLAAINRSASSCHGARGYASLVDVPFVPDLCIMAVPAQYLVNVVRTARELGVLWIYVLSSIAPELQGIQNELRRALEGGETRLLGPNCVGLHSPEGKVTFSRKADSRSGGISIISQSGGLSIDLLAQFQARRAGLRAILSVGNCLDLGPTELIEALGRDEKTSAIGLYLEDATGASDLLNTISSVAAGKPVVVLKGGRTAAGASSAATHTGALAVGHEKWAACLRDAGALEVDSPEGLVDYLTALEASARPLRGPRLAVAGNGGGMTVLVVDRLAESGLELGDLSVDTTSKIGEVTAPPGASLGNPTDIPAGSLRSGDPEALSRAIGHLLADEGIDGIIVHFNLTAFLNHEDVAELMAGLRRIFDTLGNADKPTFLALRCSPETESVHLYEEVAYAAGEAGLPIFLSALGAAVGAEAAFRGSKSITRGAAKAAHPRQRIAPVDHLQPSSRLPMLGEAATLNERLFHELSEAGLSVVETHFVNSVEDAVSVSESMSGPVALKLDSPAVVHKSDQGGVLLHVKTSRDVRSGFAELSDLARATSSDEPTWSIVVQKMMDEDFAEVFMGFERDENLGPLLVVGLGGVFVEVLGDVAFARAPVDQHAAMSLLKELKGYSILKGVRGMPARDLGALCDQISRFSHYATQLSPTVNSIDLNPILVGRVGEGAYVVDWRVSLKSHPPRAYD